MAAYLQQCVVAVLVVAAALFAAWRLPGNATRLRYIASLRHLGLRNAAARLERRVLRSMTAGGCAACSSATQNTIHPPK